MVSARKCLKRGSANDMTCLSLQVYISWSVSSSYGGVREATETAVGAAWCFHSSSSVLQIGS